MSSDNVDRTPTHSTAQLPRETADLPPGTVIGGRYVLGDPIGAGGMGVVYEARHADDGRVVALKLGSAKRRTCERMVREALLGARVLDGGVARVFDAGLCVEGFFIAMERLHGMDLRDRVTNRGPTSVAEAALIVRSVAMTCVRLHALSVIHRDLKPSNVFLCDGGMVKIIDFGIAKEKGRGPVITKPGETLGTVAFIAPEQICGSRDVEAPADCYGLGGLLYYALTGMRPHGDGSAATQSLRALEGDIPRVEKLRPEVPSWMAELIHALLVIEPSQRPDAEAVVSALGRGLLG